MGFFSAFRACLERLKAGRGPGSAGADEVDDGLDSFDLFFDLHALQIATSFFSDLNKLGHGDFGPVYKSLIPNRFDILKLPNITLAKKSWFFLGTRINPPQTLHPRATLKLVYTLAKKPWIYCVKQNKADVARAILEKTYPAKMKALHESVQTEKADEGGTGDGMITKVKGALSNPVVGTVISMCFVDRYGRRRLMHVSMIGNVIKIKQSTGTDSLSGRIPEGFDLKKGKGVDRNRFDEVHVN